MRTRPHTDAAIMFAHKGQEDTGRLRRAQIARVGCLFGGEFVCVCGRWWVSGCVGGTHKPALSCAHCAGWMPVCVCVCVCVCLFVCVCVY